MSQDLECNVSVNLILEAAHRLYSYDKVPFALTLLYVILQKYPDHVKARKYYEQFTGKVPPRQFADKKCRLYQDPSTKMFVVEDITSGRSVSFQTLEEADAYMHN